MTENEKARELIATSETTVKVDPQNGWYLKRFAALQFEGSVDNFSTNMPIHVLEQQLPKDDTMKLDDAVIEGQDIDYSKFYDEDSCCGFERSAYPLPGTRRMLYIGEQ